MSKNLIQGQTAYTISRNGKRCKPLVVSILGFEGNKVHVEIGHGDPERWHVSPLDLHLTGQEAKAAYQRLLVVELRTAQMTQMSILEELFPPAQPESVVDIINEKSVPKHEWFERDVDGRTIAYYNVPYNFGLVAKNCHSSNKPSDRPSGQPENSGAKQ